MTLWALATEPPLWERLVQYTSGPIVAALIAAGALVLQQRLTNAREKERLSSESNDRQADRDQAVAQHWRDQKLSQHLEMLQTFDECIKRMDVKIVRRARLHREHPDRVTPYPNQRAMVLTANAGAEAIFDRTIFLSDYQTQVALYEVNVKLSQLASAIANPEKHAPRARDYAAHRPYLKAIDAYKAEIRRELLLNLNKPDGAPDAGTMTIDGAGHLQPPPGHILKMTKGPRMELFSEPIDDGDSKPKNKAD